MAILQRIRGQLSHFCCQTQLLHVYTSPVCREKLSTLLSYMPGIAALDFPPGSNFTVKQRIWPFLNGIKLPVYEVVVKKAGTDALDAYRSYMKWCLEPEVDDKASITWVRNALARLKWPVAINLRDRMVWSMLASLHQGTVSAHCGVEVIWFTTAGKCCSRKHSVISWRHSRNESALDAEMTLCREKCGAPEAYQKRTSFARIGSVNQSRARV
jgi:hypothetical protein